MSNEQHVQVWYHANCPDGFGAAWAAWRHFGDTALYKPVRYSDPFPVLRMGSCSRLYILDFSYSAEMLGWLADWVPHITLLDHHKTAREMLAGFTNKADPTHLQTASPPSGIFVEFNMEYSGAMLAYEYFQDPATPDLPTERQFVAYLQDRDLWQWKLPDSKAFSAGLRSREYSFFYWNEVARSLSSQSQLITEGQAILRAQDRIVRDICREVRMVTIGGYTIPCVNTASYASEVGDFLGESYPDVPFTASYRDRADGKREWELRSRHGFDCSEIAKQLGGGGHPGAAGFRTDAPSSQFDTL